MQEVSDAVFAALAINTLQSHRLGRQDDGKRSSQHHLCDPTYQLKELNASGFSGAATRHDNGDGPTTFVLQLMKAATGKASASTA